MTFLPAADYPAVFHSIHARLADGNEILTALALNAKGWPPNDGQAATTIVHPPHRTCVPPAYEKSGGVLIRVPQRGA